MALIKNFPVKSGGGIELPISLEEVWSFVGNSTRKSIIALDNERNVYSNDDRNILKISCDGKEIWRYTPIQKTISNIIVKNQNEVLVSSYDGYLYTFSSNGQEVKKHQVSSVAIRCLTIDNQNNIYAGIDNHGIIKMNENNTIIWTFSRELLIYFVLVDNNYNLYFSDSGANIFKISSTGITIWNTGYGEGVYHGLIDSENNIYLLTYKELIKLNPNANNIFTYINNIGNMWAIALDIKNNIYCSLEDNSIESITKLSFLGEKIWNYILNINEYIAFLIVDNYDNIYYAEYINVRKLQQNLGIVVLNEAPEAMNKIYKTDILVKETLPSQTWSFTGHTNIVNSIAVDNQFNVYSASDDNILKKISPLGVEVWKFEGHTSDVYSVAVDSQLNVYSCGSGDNTVKKISPVGVEIWSFAGHTDTVRSVAVDSEFNVYSCSSDKTVKKISSTGTEVWSFIGNPDVIRAVTVDSQFNVYCGGNDKIVRKISPTNTEVWSFTVSGTIYALTVDSQFNVYSGSSVLTKLSSTGSEIWKMDPESSVRSVDVDKNFNIYYASGDTICKISQTKNEIWVLKEKDTIVRSVVADSQFNVYSGSENFKVNRYNSNIINHKIAYYK